MPSQLAQHSCLLLQLFTSLMGLLGPKTDSKVNEWMTHPDSPWEPLPVWSLLSSHWRAENPAIELIPRAPPQVLSSTRLHDCHSSWIAEAWTLWGFPRKRSCMTRRKFWGAMPAVYSRPRQQSPTRARPQEIYSAPAHALYQSRRCQSFRHKYTTICLLHKYNNLCSRCWEWLSKQGAFATSSGGLLCWAYPDSASQLAELRAQRGDAAEEDAAPMKPLTQVLAEAKQAHEDKFQAVWYAPWPLCLTNRSTEAELLVWCISVAWAVESCTSSTASSYGTAARLVACGCPLCQICFVAPEVPGAAGRVWRQARIGPWMRMSCILWTSWSRESKAGTPSRPLRSKSSWMPSARHGQTLRFFHPRRWDPKPVLEQTHVCI